MNVTKKIKEICIEKDISLGELGEKAGFTAASFYVKLSRGNGIVKISDAENILDKLDCELAIVDRKTKKVY